MQINRRSFLAWLSASPLGLLALRGSASTAEVLRLSPLDESKRTQVRADVHELVQVHGFDRNGKPWKRDLVIDGRVVGPMDVAVIRADGGRDQKPLDRYVSIEYDERGGKAERLDVPTQSIEGWSHSPEFWANDLGASVGLRIRYQNVVITPDLARRVTVARCPECA